MSRAKVIVIGNEKGGAGKTTSSMHIIASLMNLGFKVSSLDIDCRQQSLSRYIENRQITIAKKSLDLPMPDHHVMKESEANDLSQKEKDENKNFLELYESLVIKSDFVVIDTPGSNTYLSRLAHSYGDIIVTPINDSFLDLDVIARVEADSFKILKPSHYSQFIWEQKMKKAQNGGEIDWILMRNRLSFIDAKNKQNMAEALEKLAPRVGFRVAPGFSERVIFRELFLSGLTLLDFEQNIPGFTMSVSHVAARQELREMMLALKIKAIDQKIDQEEYQLEEAC